MSVLKVKNVSIRYITGDFKDIGLKEYFLRKLQGKYKVKEFWADRNINFTLEKGDMLGIIGTNGAGKSTLLKAVSGIMEPTRGSVQRKGNIAALLELASGFDGNLTVRENTYLRGAMLGYTRAFMDKTYDEIIRFAELESFQERPFKQLSSGMKRRLAFAIASLVNPDILILDEVLSVGDGAFRQKSEAKMKEVINGGATTILVSHSLTQVRSMCTKILWLHKGEQIAFGDNVKDICDAYKAMLDGGPVQAPAYCWLADKAGATDVTMLVEEGVQGEPVYSGAHNVSLRYNETEEYWELGGVSSKNIQYVGIPETVSGQPLHKIGARAFTKCRNLQEVEIPDSVEIIGRGAFYICPKLTRVKLPKNLKVIESGAFNYCTSLREVVIPEGTVRIGSSAFFDGKSLELVEIPASVAFMGNSIFNNCEKVTIRCVRGSCADYYAQKRKIPVEYM